MKHALVLGIVSAAVSAFAAEVRLSAGNAEVAVATDAPAALAEVGLSADVVVDDGTSPGGVPSTVVKVDEDGSRTVLRQGAVDVA